MSPRVELLLKALDQGYDHRSWHGPILKGSLRGLSAKQAAWRPAPSRHNIWEIAVHVAYYKYTVLRRLVRLHGGEEVRFPLKGSDWFRRPEREVDEHAWKAELKVLEETHRQLREAAAALSDSDLDTIPRGSSTTVVDLVLGVAYHDIYHAGQIQLLKRLAGW
jgi:uncharacterized damage-inducible protein DinB